MRKDFVDLCEAIPGLRAEIRYATAHNLTGHPLRGYDCGRAVATRACAAALALAFRKARERGLGLLVYDAYRPQRAVQDFMAWSEQPEDGLTKAEFYPSLAKETLFGLGYIAQHSGHSRGSTVDLTLTDAGGLPLPMGTCFDYMGPESHQGFAGLPEDVLDNRRTLRAVMAWAGFEPYENEWWHFRLMNEPYPDTYFDFDLSSIEHEGGYAHA